MTPLGDILARATRTDTGFTAHIPSTWLQGRTAYGGLSSALALHAALSCEPDLPPLRSAQIAFIGPLAGDVTVTATKLRRGRTAAFIQSDIVSEAGLGYRATFVFMAPQPSRIDLNEAPAARHAAPTPETETYTGKPEFFTHNFDILNIDAEVHGSAELLRWVRLRERDGLDPMVELLAVADALPPAALKLFGRDFVPLSSLTWIVNLLTPEPATTDGWWLVGAESHFARQGSSSQSMAIWNADGRKVAEGMQSVAIFG